MTQFQTGTASLAADVHDGVAWVRIVRPECANALDHDVEAGLEMVLPALDREPSVRVVVIAGSGRVFCAGADVKVMASRPDRLDLDPHDLVQLREQERSRLSWAMQNVIRVAEMSTPTVAAVNGAAAGAGLALACACDFRIAMSGARFITAYGRLSLPGDWGLTYLLPRLVGHQQARRMFLLGDDLDATEALACGLVDDVAEEERFPSRVEEFVARVAATTSSATGETKALLRDAPQLRRVIASEIEATLRCQETNDHRRALTEFLKGERPPGADSSKRIDGGIESRPL